MFRYKPALFFFLLLAFLYASHRAGLALGSPLPQDPDALSAVQTPDEEQIKGKIAEIENMGNLGEGLKSQVLEYYNQALIRLQSLAKYEEAAAAFLKQITSAPVQLEQAEAERDTLASEDLEEASIEVPAEPTLKLMEPMLIKEQALLSEYTNRAATLAAELQEEQARPAQCQQELMEAEQILADIESALKTPPQEEQNPLITEGNQILLATRKPTLKAKIFMLQQEQLSHDVRVALITTRHETAALQVTRANTRVKKLQILINDLRQKEADQAKRSAEAAEREALGKHPAVAAQARKNADLGQEWSDLVSEMDKATHLATERNQEKADLKKNFESTSEQVEKVGLNRLLGEVLLNKAKELRGVEEYRVGAHQRKNRISEATVRQYTHQVRMKKLTDLDEAAGNILASLAKEELTAEQRSMIHEELKILLQSELDLLKKMDGTYKLLVKELTKLENEERILTDEAKKFARFINERLLWSPSLPAVGWSTFENIPHSITWLLDKSDWAELSDVLLRETVQQPVVSALVFLLFLVLLLSRKYFYNTNNAISNKVGRVHEDSFDLTLKALLITAAVALPWPMMISYVGFLLIQSLDAPEFAKVSGSALQTLGYLLFGLLFLKFLCHSKGVAAIHFRWHQNTIRLIRRNLNFLIPLFLPIVFISMLIHRLSGEEANIYDESLGRLAFITALALLTWSTQRILRPKGGIPQTFLAKHPESWLARLKYIWYPAVVGMPLFMAVLASVGYYHTSGQLTNRLLETILLLLGALIIHETIMRGFLVAQRRLALARARQKREEEKAARAEEERGEGQEEEDSVVLDIPELDISTISEQSRKLVHILIYLSLILSLYFIWAGVLPALGIFNEVELWQHTVVGPEGPELVPITLAGVLFAIFVAIITFVAAANIPGLLEIVILQRLPMEPGSRYAITTVSRYLITAIGIVVTFSILGVSWSNLQWLVAALSVGLGFGLQEIVANFVSGLIILFERPVRIGDTITVGEVTGTVTRIRIRATTITDRDRKELIVPNKNFITGDVVNWTLADPVTRIKIPVGFAYGTDTGLAVKTVMEVLQSNPVALEDPKPRLLFREFGDNSLNFEARVYVRGGSNLLRMRSTTIHELHMAIDQACRKNGLEIAFPQRDIHIRSIKAPLRLDETCEKDDQGKA